MEAPQAPELKEPFPAIVSGAFKQTAHAEKKSCRVFRVPPYSKSSDWSQQCMQPLLVILQTLQPRHAPLYTSCTSLGTLAVVSTIWSSLCVSFCLINSSSFQLFLFFLSRFSHLRTPLFSFFFPHSFIGLVAQCLNLFIKQCLDSTLHHSIIIHTSTVYCLNSLLPCI